jgi:hypothetical protein
VATQRMCDTLKPSQGVQALQRLTLSYVKDLAYSPARWQPCCGQSLEQTKG